MSTVREAFRPGASSRARGEKPRLDLRICDADVDLLVQSFDDLFRRALRSANAEPCACLDGGDRECRPAPADTHRLVRASPVIAARKARPASGAGACSVKGLMGITAVEPVSLHRPAMRDHTNPPRPPPTAEQRDNSRLHSITSSARASRV